MEFRLMTEQELKDFDPVLVEDKDINWRAYGEAYTGRAIYDYYQGISVVKKENPTVCLFALHGPNGNKRFFKNIEDYHLKLSSVLCMLKDGICFESKFRTDIKICPGFSLGIGIQPTCSFT